MDTYILFVCFVLYLHSFHLEVGHIEVSRPGIEPSPLQWLHWILNPLSHKGIAIHSFFFFFFLFRATPVAYGNSQTEGWIGATAAQPKPQPQKHASVIYTTAHGNAGFMTHWARPGIEPTSSWILIGFTSFVPQRELPINSLKASFFCISIFLNKTIHLCNYCV